MNQGAKLTVREKIKLLSGSGMMESTGIPEKGILPIVMSDGPMGLRFQKKDKDSLGIHDSEPATVLLSGPAIASSWNPEVAKIMGKVIGSEARYYGVHLVLGPALNLIRNPLCGRNSEYYSEDPLLAGTLGAFYIQGVQEAGADCCVKHFAANNQETEREYLDVICDEDALHELYLKVFEIAIKKGHPAAVMTSLSKINGEYCSSNEWLLREVLRKEWNYDGLILTDWFGVDDRAKAIIAGLNLEMPGNNGKSAQMEERALVDGKLPMQAVDEAAEYIIKASKKLTEQADASRSICLSELLNEHDALVEKAAEESIVLLKNDGVLPICVGSRICVIGPYAKHALFQTNGSGAVHESNSESPFDAIVRINGRNNTQYAQGYTMGGEDGSDEQQLESEALLTAQHAELVLYFIAVNPESEGEGKDRNDYAFPENQLHLLHEIVQVNSKLIVIAMNGGAAPIPSKEPLGILECFYGGQEVGRALAKIIFGSVNPSGHLPVSIPAQKEQIISWENFALPLEKVEYREGLFMGYRGYHTKGIPVQWPFGFGLSYSTFKICSLKLSREKTSVNELLLENIEVSGLIRNTSERGGAQVIQLYVDNETGWKKRPKRELRAFTKIFLNPGEEKEFSFVLGAEEFQCWDERIHDWSIPAGKYSVGVGFSCEDIQESTDIMISDDMPVPDQITGWSKTERLLETPAGRVFFSKLCEMAENGAEIPYLSDSQGKKTEEILVNLPLRLVHLMVWSRMTDSEFMDQINKINQDMYCRYIEQRKKLMIEKLS